ncbi:hypothetical protein EYZ11_004474 [Aspergillus tanneri]|uniref:Tubby C-terminal domain-containing protein n=1 Tax=Aspergillus tanneri TaxID=1220188 RepID=A0A4S3JKR6_9EURO|nr:uncharacterized protein ATNIH1004_008236 [Aspergillus tanneri]KAA8644039.1 hypothetical protein ATNIH1004_008236 [Aspergillus tanneri]THC96053.1 hypothetical protein EYZ11_004474 [Aspergillus tanneri]
MFRSDSQPSKLRRASLLPRIRRTLKAPDRPIAIRKECITDRKTTLVLRPYGDAQSEVAYQICDLDGVTQLTVSGHKFGGRSCREFRDSSGLPLFELHKKSSFRTGWCVTLPGCVSANIATGGLRRSFSSSVESFYLSFENVAALDCKHKEDKQLTLEIERFGNALASFDIVDGDRKVAEVRESIPHNRTLALMPGSKRGWRPAIDIIIMPHVDITLATVIAVIASDSTFTANY